MLSNTVFATGTGRLCNIMFQYCAAATFAKRINKKFSGYYNYQEFGDYPDYKVDLTIFPKQLTLSEVKQTCITHKDMYILDTTNITNEKYNNAIESCKNINSPIMLHGYSQALYMIDKQIANELFSPSQSIINEIKTLYGDLTNIVSCHIRRGDYLNWGNNLIYPTYTYENIKTIKEQYFSNKKILIISDDLEWCKYVFKENDYLFADKISNILDKDLLDFYIQTQCGGGNILSASTFSWWGAYLNNTNNSIKICPSIWLKNNPEFTNSLIPNDWIKYI